MSGAPAASVRNAHTHRQHALPPILPRAATLSANVWLSDSEIVCVTAASRATASLLTQHLSAALSVTSRSRHTLTDLSLSSLVQSFYPFLPASQFTGAFSSPLVWFRVTNILFISNRRVTIFLTCMFDFIFTILEARRLKTKTKHVASASKWP